ncbi:MAG TPA: DUF2784 domain-containing protein [Rhodocyclaceae bacterium]|nr:DUF2784 domain-containing protein [Rhodocyclaceae bacterium]
MVFRWLADLTVGLHFAFVAFVVLGGLIALRRPRAAWLHLPAALWGILVEYAGWICPLTPLEQWLRLRAGQAGYGGGFVEHYLLPVLYPAGLGRPTQWLLGTLVLAINAAVYGWLLWKRKGSRSSLS